jgi:hypothetical protein
VTTHQALQITDPEGSVLVVARVADAVYTIDLAYSSGEPFRLFEADRAKLRAFLDPLDG